MSMSYADMSALQAMYDTAGSLQAKQIANQYKLGKSEISARLKIAAQQSKDTRYGIDAERETALANIEQARQEMLRIGIPEMEIKRFVAESTKALAESEIALKRDLALGYVTSSTALDPAGQQRYATLQQEITGLTEQARTAGMGSPEAAGYQQQIAAKQAELATLVGTTRSPTLEREGFLQDQLEQQRRYEFDVAQFGAQLASTPDTYFQARRFQGVDVPRLMGGAGAQTTGPTGGPTPGIATMGAYLSGQDPYGGQMEGIRSASAAGEQAFGLDPYTQAQSGGPRVAPTTPHPWNPQMPTYGADQTLRGLDPYTQAQAAGYSAGAPPPRGSTVPGGGTVPEMSMEGAGGTPYGGTAPNMETGYWSPADQAASQQPAPTGNIDLGTPRTPIDDRDKQIAQIARASPPSPYDGLNERDTATLKLMESIYKKGGQAIAGGEYERLAGSGRLGFMQSAGRLLGYDPNEFASQYQAYRPSQGDSRLA